MSKPPQHYILSARTIGVDQGVVTCTCGWQHSGTMRECFRMAKAHLGEPLPDYPDHKVVESPCTNCGRMMDGAMPADGKHKEAPKPGSVSLCISCGHIMVFGDDMRLRDPTDAEAKEFAGDPEVLKASSAIAQLKKELGKR